MSRLYSSRIVYEQDKAGSPLTLDELLILNQLEIERRINTHAAAEFLQKPEGEARAVLERLTEKSLVEAKGEKRGRVYHLSAMLYEHFDNLPGYVRTRGFDKIQQKQMVLTVLETATDGRITREGVADLCKITRPKAYHLLKKMYDDGELEKYGESRGTYYTRKRTKNTRNT